MNKNKMSTRMLTGTALFTAVVVVLQLLGSFIHFGPFSVSLVLLPIVLGSALYGAGAGAWLGFAFGVTVLLSGDAALFLPVNPLGTVLTVLLKGTLAGLCAAYAYKLISRKNVYAGVIVAAIVCPVVNTGVFLLGCLLFFMDTVSQWAAAAGFANAGSYLILGMVGLNFVVEMAVNIILCPVILRLIKLSKKGKA